VTPAYTIYAKNGESKARVSACALSSNLNLQRVVYAIVILQYGMKWLIIVLNLFKKLNAHHSKQQDLPALQSNHVMVLQQTRESQMGELFEDSNLRTICIKCVTILPKDIQLTCRMRRECD